MVEADRTNRTFRYEQWRAVAAGILESAGTTFLLLIAVKFFAASGVSKGVIAAGGSLGLLLSPVVVSLATHFQWRVSKAASCVLAFGAACFGVAALWPAKAVFVAGSVLGMATTSLIIPLLTQMYQENYPEGTRGRLFSRTVII